MWEAPPGGPHRPVGGGARQPQLTTEHAHRGLPVGRLPFACSDRPSCVRDSQASLDEEHSSRRRARDRCIAGAVRESVQLEVGVEVQQRCFQRQSISRGRAIQCLPTFARMTGTKRRRTHIARRGRSMGATVRGCHAAPMQSRKQASAGPTRDAWFATNGSANLARTARSLSRGSTRRTPPCRHRGRRHGPHYPSRASASPKSGRPDLGRAQ